ncbi:MAG: hypothetical protein KME26_27040 [Oscillatoria princeps RMCB-10]|jgi:hypothetical protein|nr:hypothetical protein [Oscillatoria princeps RMCB-10]
MKPYQGIAKRLVLFIAPIVAAPALSQAPAMAATLAFSEAAFQFDNFSHSAYSLGTTTNANTLALVTGPASSTIATAAAMAYFVPESAGNISLSAASGQGSNYVGLAQSMAQVVGNFLVGPGESFGFNFNASLALGSAVDNPKEMASAAGRTAFFLFGSTDGEPASLLDYFSVLGQVTTPGNNFLDWQSSDNINYTSDTSLNYTDTESLALAAFEGWYQRSFDSQIQLTLVEYKQNEAHVKAPEPSFRLAFPLLLFFICVSWKSRRKAAILGQLDITKIEKNSSL